MYCVNCGKELTDGSRFCPHCGSKQNDTTKKIMPEKKMGSVTIHCEKIVGEIYIYVDDVMYRVTHKNKESIYVKLTPEIHFIEASRYKKSYSDGVASFGDKAGEIGTSGLLGGIGAIVGLSANISAAVTSNMMKAGEGRCAIDLRDGEDVTVRVSQGMFGKLEVEEV